MSEGEPTSNAIRTALLIVGGLVVLGGLAWLGLAPGERVAEPGARAEQAASSSAPQRTSVADPSGGPVPSVLSGQTFSISKDELQEGGKLVLDLMLGEPSRTGEPLEGRIISPESREMPLSAVVSEDRMSTRVAVPAGWLSSGRHIIEVKTTDQSHFPIRRYALEVR